MVYSVPKSLNRQENEIVFVITHPADTHTIQINQQKYSAKKFLILIYT